MQALVLGGVENILYQAVADPVIQDPGDALIRMSRAGICGSDLHVYHGREAGIDPGTVMGHEFTGTVVETGKDVRTFRSGDRVLSPFTTSCGHCYFCRTGLTCRCERGHLFGWVSKGIGLEGAQAEYVRVPLADSTLLPLSNDLTEEKGLLLGDVFSTGYFCAEQAGIHKKGVYAVIGCGPVGLMTIMAAKNLGADKLLAIDLNWERLRLAEESGAIPVNISDQDPLQWVQSLTDGRGADAVMEVVGNAEAMSMAIRLIRPGGIISSVGVHTESDFSFTPAQAYDKNLIFKTGRCPARYYAEKLIREEIVQRIPVERIITHRLSLSEGPRAYEMFDKKKDHCIKTVLQP